LVHTSFNTLHILDTRVLKPLTHIHPLPQPILKRSGGLSPLKGSPLGRSPKSGGGLVGLRRDEGILRGKTGLYKRSKFSPCGKWILSGHLVYDTDTGEVVGEFETPTKGCRGPVVDVDWHPLDFTCVLMEWSDGASGNSLGGAYIYTFDPSCKPLKVFLFICCFCPWVF
jgi:hypothetical protein